MDSSATDKELLFAALVTREGLAPPEQVLRAVEAYLAGTTASLGANLEDRGVLTPVERKAVDASVATAFHDLFATVARTERSPQVNLADEEDEDLIPGEQEGRYTIRGVHGRGGQAKVLLAFDETIGRDVALKVLAASLHDIPTDTPSSRLSAPGSVRFLREARVTGQLEHPNIVPVHELGRREDGSLYYAMRLVRGSTLSSKLKECESLDERMKWLGAFWDVCHATAYAHSRGVVHRDLKPSNIMVGEFGETVLLDWGISKVQGRADIGARDLEREISLLEAEDTGETVNGSAIGTPAYMSPEQAAGAVADIDERSDIWGLGAVLYQILTGRPPFTARSRQAILLKVRKHRIRPVRERCPQAPAELAAIAEKALRRDKSKRYGSAKELADDLGAYMTGSRVSAYAYSAWELLRRFAAQNKSAFIAAGVVLAVILGALVALTISYRNEAAARRQEHQERLAASFHLSRAFVEKASRLMEDRRIPTATVLASASLVHNPVHPGSPYHSADFIERYPRSHDLRVEAASLLFRADLQLSAGLERVFATSEVVTRPAVSPDGRWIAAGGFDRKVRLWDTRTGKVRNLPDLRANVHDLAFTTDGRRLVTAGNQGRVRVWDTQTLAPQQLFEDHGDRAYAVALSPDDRLVAAASWDGRVSLRELDTGRLRRMLTGHRGRANCVAFSPDGSLLATGGEDKIIRLWRFPGAENVATCHRESEVQSLAFSPDGNLLVSGDEHGHVVIRDLSGGEAEQVFVAHAERVADLAFSPDGRLLVSAGYDRTARVWEMPRGRLLLTLDRFSAFVSGVALSPDGSRLVASSYDNKLRLFHLRPERGPTTLRGHEGLINAVLYSPAGDRLVSAGWDKTARVWDARTGALQFVLRGHRSVIGGVAVHPAGDLVATASWDRDIRLWSLATGKTTRVLEGHEDSAFWVSISPDGKTLASSGVDRTVRLWNLPTGEPRSVLRGHQRSVYRTAFSPDGKLLASTSYDRTVRVWDVERGVSVRTLSGHSDWVSGVAFSSDGRRIVSCGKAGEVIIWDARDGRELGRLAGHEHWVNQVTFSPDGQLLATASDDFTVRVWSAASGQMLLKLPTRKEAVGVAFSPDGGHLALGDGSAVRVYPLDFSYLERDPQDLLPAAERASGVVLRGFEIVEAPD